jgi:hypothetical protein
MSIMKRLALSALALALGCGGSAPMHREPDEYTGCGTDEQWQTFEDNEPLVMPASMTGPVLTQPAAGAMVTSATKPILQWNQDPGDPGQNDGDVIHTNGPGCMDCCPQFNIGALTALHLPAISGDTYDLQFTVGSAYAWRTITTLQEWTPPDALWAQMKGKRVSVKIYRMTILVNQLKQGPFVAPAPSTFSVSN